ncbi:MAG: hypothetical protein ABFC24_12410 [Methanoregulaceae archaeon]
MGSKDDVMQHFIENDLRRHFPECQGWKIVLREILSGYDQVISIERWSTKGEERIIVGFSFEPVVSGSLIQKIANGPESAPANSRYIRRALLVPQGSDVSALPSTTEVYRMKNFVYRDSELIWLKHPSHRFGRSEKNTVQMETPVSPAL